MKDLKLLIVVLLTLSQMACTDDLYTEEGFSEGSSRVDVESVDNGSSNLTSKQILESSTFYNSNMEVRGLFQTFRRSNSGQVINDYMYLNLVQWPEKLTLQNDYFMQFFRITGDNGIREVNPTSAPIFFIHKSSGQILNEANPVNNISKSVIDSLISQHSLANSGITSANFLGSFAPVLKNMSLEYDAAIMAIYDITQNNSVVGSIDVLLPSFHADPNEYAKTHISFLNQMHPMYERRNSGLSDDQFKSEGDRLCLQHL